MAQTNKYLYHYFDHWFRGGQIWVYSDPHFRDFDQYLRRAKLAEERSKQYIENDFEDILLSALGALEAGYVREGGPDGPKIPYTKEMCLDDIDEAQVRWINKYVGKNDTLIILGDVIEKNHIEEGLKYVSKLKGYKVLIKGNHEKGTENYERKVSYHKEVINEELMASRLVLDDNHLFDEVVPGGLQISEKVYLSHEPKDDPDLFSIHGHTHHLLSHYDDHHLNVCAEAINYTPVSLLNMYKDGAFKSINSTHRKTIDKATERKKKRLANN